MTPATRGPIGNVGRLDEMRPQGIPRRVGCKYPNGAVLYRRDPPPAAPENTASTSTSSTSK